MKERQPRHSQASQAYEDERGNEQLFVDSITNYATLDDIFASNANISQKNGSLLGTKTKSSAAGTQVFEKQREKIFAINAIKRFSALSEAREIFRFEGSKLNLEYPLNFHRTAKCHWVSLDDNVSIYKSFEFKTAFYKNLVTCGMVWTCPVCSAKIQERRRLEIATAMDLQYKTTGKCVMITFTFPHTSFDSCSDLVLRQRDAFRRLRHTRLYKSTCKNIGYIGLIRSLEVVFGKNGWHPHTHELWFVDGDANAEKLKKSLIRQWRKACQNSLLLSQTDLSKISHFNRYSVDIKDFAKNSDYLQKSELGHWGADRELAKSTSKQASSKGLHPFELLEKSASGQMQYRAKYLEYSKAFFRARQLYWTNDLKTHFQIDHLSDSAIASKTEETAFLIAILTPYDWRLIRKYDHIANALILAVNGGSIALQNLLNQLKKLEKNND
jgi:hypothetical protein